MIIRNGLFLIFFFSIFLFKSHGNALEIIRDTELENFTDEIVATLLNENDINVSDLNIYFVNSNELNAFVTGGKNMFINTEIIVEAEDYREYASVLAHELAHILGGHIFNTSIELSSLSGKALPIYLLGIIGIMSGATETGLASVMVGQASVADSFTYYSRTQEASADQAAVNLMCANKIDAKYFANFLNKIENYDDRNFTGDQNYRSTHPSTENRIYWVNSAIENIACEYDEDKELTTKFDLLKAKIHGFTHSYHETEAVYNNNDDASLYATAVSNYFKGMHSESINNLELLINRYPSNPYFKELLAEIYFANLDYEKAISFQKQAIEQIENVDDLYLMILSNYLMASNESYNSNESILFLKKALHLNSKNSYSWYLLARAYADMDQIALANYATAERYFLIGERELSYEFAVKALKHIEENSPEWYRSHDLIEILQKEVSKR